LTNANFLTANARQFFDGQQADLLPWESALDYRGKVPWTTDGNRFALPWESALHYRGKVPRSPSGNS